MNIVKATIVVLLGACSFASRIVAAECPNILFCIADDWELHAGAYGTPWVRTPAFDRIAKNGVLFQHADLERRGLLENTLVIVTSDHGPPFPRGKGNVYELANHVPLAMLYIENFEPARWPGGNPETGYMDCDAGKTKSVILQSHRADASDPFWALCFGLRPPEEFYNLTSDPDCVQNLAALPNFATQKTKLRDQMNSELRAQGDPRMYGSGGIFDAYEHSTRANVGHYERFMRGEKINAGWIDSDDID